MFSKLKKTKAFRFIFTFIRILIGIWVLLLIFLLPVICIELYLGKGLNEIFNESLDMLIENGFFLAFWGIIILLIWGFYSLINYALNNQNGKVYKVIEIVNGICIIILIFTGIYFIKILYEENFKIFTLLICAAAFSIYYWIAKINK